MKRKQKNQRYQSQSNKKQSLLTTQKDLLFKILSSNDDATTWKILVLDSYNRAIVSSQLKMKDLRDNNITLYLNLKDKRQSIHGVTIVYLIEPTTQNIQIIAQDLLEDKYSSVHIHFSSEPSAGLLSALANKLSSSKKSTVLSRISKIQYSCIGYYSIDNSMCILPTQTQIANLLRALNLQPLFIYHSSNEKSKKLVQKIKLKLNGPILHESEQTKKTNYAYFHIFNRQNDLFPVLSHGITYAALLENIYKINKTGSKVTKNKESFELSLQDQIWVKKKNMLISEMKLGETSNQISSKMVGLSSEEYTEQNEKFKKIEWHLNNAGDLIGEAKRRRLNQFYEIEIQIYNKGIISKELNRDIITLLKEAAELEDKVRLLMICLIYGDHIQELKQFEEVFPEILKNARYTQAKEKKSKGLVIESGSAKYVKKFAKGIWKNLISAEKKLRITKQVEKVKGSNSSDLYDSGLIIEGIHGNVEIGQINVHRHIVYCLGGVSFHQYGNLIEFNQDVVYAGDQVVSFRDII